MRQQPVHINGLDHGGDAPHLILQQAELIAQDLERYRLACRLAGNRASSHPEVMLDGGRQVFDRRSLDEIEVERSGRKAFEARQDLDPDEQLDPLQLDQDVGRHPTGDVGKLLLHRPRHLARVKAIVVVRPVRASRGHAHQVKATDQNQAGRPDRVQQREDGAKQGEGATDQVPSAGEKVGETVRQHAVTKPPT